MRFYFIILKFLKAYKNHVCLLYFQIYISILINFHGKFNIDIYYISRLQQNIRTIEYTYYMYIKFLTFRNCAFLGISL